EVSTALLALARHDDSRKCLLLIEAILDTPNLAERLLQVLRPDKAKTAGATVAADINAALSRGGEQ
ncbi:MAG: transcriptional regulator, partial [Terriglobales bacterium]